MAKKDGGIVKNWQLHILYDDEVSAKKAKDVHPNMGVDKLMVFTGTVVDDPTGRWLPGYHMRSTLVLNHDTETGIVETLNTMYKLEGPGDNDVIPDMGKEVMNIFY